MSDDAFDIVIVGAGAAGCVAASYLAGHTDASIALIEAGNPTERISGKTIICVRP